LRILTAFGYYCKILSLIILLESCSNYAPVPSNHFEGDENIAGLNPPAATSDFSITKNSNTLSITWTATTDPDTGDYSQGYYLYQYTSSTLPAKPYDETYYWLSLFSEVVCTGTSCSLSAYLSSASATGCIGIASYNDCRYSEIKTACY
jgi:hypothetical protein